MARAKNAKHALSNVEGDAKVMGRGMSSRANARDLRKISPGVYPELAEGVEMTTLFRCELGGLAR